MKCQRGATLVELIIVIGIIVAVSSGVFVLARHVDDARQVDRQAKDFHALIEAIDAANGSSIGHFTGISAASVAGDALAPAGMIESAGLRSAWGPITIDPLTLDAQRPNAHARINYAGVPSTFCVPFVSSIHKGEAAVHVNGVLAATKGVGLNRPQLARACETTFVSVVIDHDGGGNGDRALL